MVEENPQIEKPTSSSTINPEQRKKDPSSTLRILLKFYKLLFTKWRHKKKNEEDYSQKTEAKVEVLEEDTRNKVHIFLHLYVLLY